jgi:hypothetical protein
MAFIEIQHISAPHSLHHLGHTFVFQGREQQVQVVAHQYIGMHLYILLLRMFLQQSQHSLEISVVHEDGLTVIAPQNDVVRVSSESETGQAGHVSIIIGI